MDTQSLFYFFLLLFCFLTFMLKNVFVYAIIWMDLSFIKIDFSDSPFPPITVCSVELLQHWSLSTSVDLWAVISAVHARMEHVRRRSSGGL